MLLGGSLSCRVGNGNAGLVMRPGRLSDRSGQVTVELAVVLPAVIIVAVIVVNAMTFFAACAEFDRVGRNAVRLCAASSSHDVDLAQAAAGVESAVEDSMFLDGDEVEVSAYQGDSGFVRFELVLRFRPGLFGMGLRDEVLGVQLPALTHTVELTVDRYKPGMLV